MENGPEQKQNYIRNIGASRNRTIRIEVVGEVSDAERHFLDGIGYFTAGTMSKDSIAHTTYVSEMMTKLIRHIVKHLNGDEKAAE